MTELLTVDLMSICVVAIDWQCSHYYLIHWSGTQTQTIFNQLESIVN